MPFYRREISLLIYELFDKLLCYKKQTHKYRPHSRHRTRLLINKQTQQQLKSSLFDNLCCYAKSLQSKFHSFLCTLYHVFWFRAANEFRSGRNGFLYVYWSVQWIAIFSILSLHSWQHVLPYEHILR